MIFQIFKNPRSQDRTGIMIVVVLNPSPVAVKVHSVPRTRWLLRAHPKSLGLRRMRQKYYILLLYICRCHPPTTTKLLGHNT